MEAGNNVSIDILIVEDSPTQAEQLGYLLEQSGYGVRLAGNGRDGLAAVRERRPTLVISDVVMPEMDGYSMCRAIKADPALKDIPVVIVTSLAGIEDIARSLECGADNFLRKPYDPKMLLARVEYILANRELRRGKKLPAGMELYLEGKKHYITSEREQIIDLLISTYEEAMHMNEELQARQREIAHSNQTLKGLFHIADELNRVTAEARVCELALAGIMELPLFVSGWILLADGDGGCRLAAASNLPVPLAAQVLEGDCRCWRDFLASGQERNTSVVDCERLEKLGGGRHASVPVASDHRCLGVINLMTIEGESLGDEDLKMLDAIGNQVAVALERAHLVQHLESLVDQRTAALQAEVEERRRAEEKVASLNRIYAVLSGINALIVRVHERLELFQEFCRIAVEYGRFGLAWIGMRDADSFMVKPVAWQGCEKWVGTGADFPGLAEVEAQGLGALQEVMDERRPLVCRDLATAVAMPFAQEAVARGYGALAALPLLVGGNPVGLLVLYAPDPGVFDAGEMLLLEELAGDIAFALDHIAKEERIDYLACYDALTGLPNRNLVMDRLHQGMGAAQRHQRGMAVVCLDLDRFKIINDSLGHHVGDRVLQAVAKALLSCARDGDTVGRLGADQFVLICSDLGSAAMVGQIIDRIYGVLAMPIAVEGESLRITASMGICLYPQDGDEAASLLKHAELAMFQAKEKGGNNHRLFTPDLNVRVFERLHVETRLGQALDNGELEVFYQPQVSAASGVINGMEALLRWRHPEHGIILPGEFVPIAEESGLIVQIGQWVLHEACRQNKQWHDEGLSDFPVSVNLSMAQFREESLLAAIRRIVDGVGLEPRFLELEVTESLIMGNVERFIFFLRQIKEMGALISIDDFGTGYSSLNYLKRLPVDRLKVDYTFVRDITLDPGSAAICRAIIAMAHNLRLGVVAEGVETESQALYLGRHFCDTLQGFLMCRPLPAEDITALLRRREPLLRPLPELSSQRTLLIVDAEENVRSTLVRLLRGDGYLILTANGPREAFDLLAKHEVGVVISDQHMAEMTGTEFLARVRNIYPSAIRIVLSGYTDLKTVTAAVNEGRVYKFLLKPWEDEALRGTLRDAFWEYELSRGRIANWWSDKPPPEPEEKIGKTAGA